MVTGPFLIINDRTASANPTPFPMPSEYTVIVVTAAPSPGLTIRPCATLSPLPPAVYPISVSNRPTKAQRREWRRQLRKR